MMRYLIKLECRVCCITSAEFSSVTLSCLTLCDAMDCRRQGSLFITNSWSLPKLMSIELDGDAIQPSYPLSSPSSPTFTLSKHQGLFQWVSSLHQAAKVLELQHWSFQWIFRTDFLYVSLTGSPCSPRNSRVFPNTTVQKHQFLGTQLSLYSKSHIHYY